MYTTPQDHPAMIWGPMTHPAWICVRAVDESERNQEQFCFSKRNKFVGATAIFPQSLGLFFRYFFVFCRGLACLPSSDFYAHAFQHNPTCKACCCRISSLSVCMGHSFCASRARSWPRQTPHDLRCAPSPKLKLPTLRKERTS